MAHTARSVVLFILAAAASGLATAQAQYPEALLEPPEEVPEALSFFAPFFFPKVLQDEYALKEYIRSEEFARFRKVHGDAQAVDAIFNRALHLSWNNAYEALLISFLGTLDHRSFGVRLPLIGNLLWFPLTSEFEDEFRERHEALPSALYPDTPRDGQGDKDKLQHFFGSAFLALVTESADAAERLGMFIEWGEDRFIVDGAFDERDIRAGRQGQRFGLGLMADKTLRPSRFLVPDAQGDPGGH